MKNTKNTKTNQHPNVTVSKHAFDRLRERTDFGTTDSEWVADNAWRHGLDPSQFSGSMRHWLENIENRKENAKAVLKVYQGVCFIFSSDALLITVYPWDDRKAG